MNQFDIHSIQGFNQVGIAVRDAEAAMKFMESAFGIKLFLITMPEAKAFLRGREVRFVTRIAIGHVGTVDLEFMEILEGEHIVQEFLDTRGPGIHHLGIYVDDLNAAVDEWERGGAKVVQRTAHPDGIGTAYLDTEKELGAMYVEIIQLPKPPKEQPS
ncbi:MAG: hypothetical protein EPN93_06510 [Spirochaetes bacterium]|nr:MAG: hypothetical protein EPN93_06510 [Spirochaetota bacterium]